MAAGAATTWRARVGRHVPALVLLAGATAALAPFVVLAWHASPAADDFCFANASRLGLLDMQRTYYLTWTGRYTTTLLEGLVGRWDLFTVYPWLCLGTLAGTLLAFRAVIAAVTRGAATAFEVTVAAAVATAVFAGGLPSMVEAFFWLSSVVTYQWGVVAFLAWLALLLRPADGGGGPSTIRRRAAIMALTLVLPGFNEILALVVLLVLAGFVAAGWRHGRPDRFVLGLLGLVAILTAASLLAPGNAVRSATYPDLPTRHALGFAAAETLRQTVRFVGTYAALPALWGAACAAWCWAPVRARMGEVGARWAWLAMLALLGLLYATLFPIYWEYGTANVTGEGRTYNVSFLVLGAAVLASAGAVARTREARSWAWPAWLAQRRVLAGRLLAAALALLMLGTPGVRRAFEATETAGAFRAALGARERLLTTERNRGRAVFVEPVQPRPDGLFWSDVEQDPSHWINNCVATYYGLGSVQRR